MRENCYHCYRPQSSCMCEHFGRYDTNFKYVILMHPMEFKKVKNNTGIFTHRQLSNSELIVDIDFSKNKRVNNLIEDSQAYLLYPARDAISIDKEPIPKSDTKRTIFILDATWPCAKKMLRLSQNLQKLAKISFNNHLPSAYEIKKQPQENYLSTIESVYLLINKLSLQSQEHTLDKKFLNSFHQMIHYQKKCIINPDNKKYSRDEV